MELSEDLPAKNVTHSSSSPSSKLQLSATTYGSLQFLNEQLNGPDVMGNEILSSLQMSLNPAKLVLNVMQGSFPHIWEKGDTGFEAGVMKNYILMLEHLKRVSPQIHPQIKEEAIKLAVEWKVKLTASTTNSLEVLAFLQLLATYELSSSFNGDEILKLFEVVAEYKQALEVCQSLGFLDQIPGKFSEY
uniref:FRIGIDA-like protein n=1 Tax=Fagus sylvatica TaxID=28930 RepID=A0A2N9EFP1_FAGSY